jgi:hypothetical protein
MIIESLILPYFLFFLQCPGMEGVVNEDLPNSWECPKCCKEGKNVEYRVSDFVFVTVY